MSALPPPRAKIMVPLPDDESGIEIESVWAFDLGEDRYEIDNCPFYVYGLSLGDIVCALRGEGKTVPIFHRILVKSENQTLRVLFAIRLEAGNDTEFVLQKLVALGCGYEGANRRYFAINVPPAVDLEAVTRLLSEYGVDWERADVRGPASR